MYPDDFEENKFRPKQIFIAFVCLLLVILLAQNTEVVTLRFLFWKISMSRIILIPLVFLVGGLVGFLIAKSRGSDF